MRTTVVSACSGDARQIQTPRASSASFVRRLKQPIRNVTGVRLLSAVVPNSSYNVPAGSLTVRVSGGGAVVCPIRSGSYTPHSLLAALQIALAGGTVRATIGCDLRLTFSASVPGVSIEIQDGLRECCGGGQGALVQVSAGEFALTMPDPCQPGVTTPRLYVVRVREAREDVAHFPRTQHDTITYYLPAGQQEVRLDPPADCIRALSIDVLDENGRLWDLNNLDVSLLFEIRWAEAACRKKSDRQ